MLVLKVLEGGPLHGYAIAVRLERMSKDVLKASKRARSIRRLPMERRGWLARRGQLTETGRRARFYKLTKSAARSSRPKPPAGCG